MAMKQGVITAVIIETAFVCGIIFFPFGWKGPSPQKTAANKPEKNAEAHEEPTAQFMTSVATNPADGNQNESSKKTGANNEESVRIVSTPEIFTESKKDKYDKALVIATWLLVFVGGFQILYLWRTVIATRDNAKAAMLNAKAVINAERPWLFIPMGDEFSEIKEPILPDVGDNRATFVAFDLKNFGKSPARVVEQKIGLFLGQDDRAIPNIAAYEPQDAINDDYAFPQGATVPVQAVLEPSAYITPEDKAAVLASRKFLWLCGYCKYRNASDMEKDVVYETRFCYLWINNTDRPKNFWIIRGPKEYSRAI